MFFALNRGVQRGDHTMMVLTMKHNSSYERNGVRFHNFTALVLSARFVEELIPSFPGSTVILWALGKLVPDTSLTDFLPKSIGKGTTIGAWVSTETLYLYGASLKGAFSDFRKDRYLIGSINCVYSQYKPDESGIIWEPDDLPSPGPTTHFQAPSNDGELYLPITTESETVLRVIEDDDRASMEFFTLYPAFLYHFSGVALDDTNTSNKSFLDSRILPNFSLQYYHAWYGPRLLYSEVPPFPEGSFFASLGYMRGVNLVKGVYSEALDLTCESSLDMVWWQRPVLPAPNPAVYFAPPVIEKPPSKAFGKVLESSFVGANNGAHITSSVVMDDDTLLLDNGVLEV